MSLRLLGIEISCVNNIITERKWERTSFDRRKQTQSWSENKQIKAWCRTVCYKENKGLVISKYLDVLLHHCLMYLFITYLSTDAVSSVDYICVE